MVPSQLSAMKMRTLPFWAILGLLTVVHSRPSTIVAEEVYREAVTDGYIIDNSYLNSFTTESAKTPEATQASQQPFPEERDMMEGSGDTVDKAVTFVDLKYGGKSTTATPSAWSTEALSPESKESELLEGSGDVTDASIFLHNGGKHNISTTLSVPPAGGTEQPPLESNTNDLLEATEDTTDMSVLLHHGSKHHVTTTTSASAAWGTEEPSLESNNNDLLEATGDTTDTSAFVQHGGKHMTTMTNASPAWSTQQSKESDLLEGSRDATDVFSFLQNESKHDVSTTMSGPSGGSTQQPSSEFEESDSSKESGESTDSSIFPQHGRKHDVSTPASVTHTQSPSTALLPGDTDGSGSGDMITHFTTSSSTSISNTEIKEASSNPMLRKIAPSVIDDLHVQSVGSKAHRIEEPTSLSSVGSQTPAWAIILAFVGGVALLVMICVAIATRDKWNAPNKAVSPNSESEMKSISQQKDVEMETLMHKEQPRENGRVTEYTVIPLDELPEKYSSD